MRRSMRHLLIGLTVGILALSAAASAVAKGKPAPSGVTIRSVSCSSSASAGTWTLAFSWTQKKTTPTAFALNDPSMSSGWGGGLTTADQASRSYDETLTGAVGGSPTDTWTFSLYAYVNGSDVLLASTTLNCSQT